MVEMYHLRPGSLGLSKAMVLCLPVKPLKPVHFRKKIKIIRLERNFGSGQSHIHAVLLVSSFSTTKGTYPDIQIQPISIGILCTLILALVGQ